MGRSKLTKTPIPPKLTKTPMSSIPTPSLMIVLSPNLIYPPKLTAPLTPTKTILTPTYPPSQTPPAPTPLTRTPLTPTPLTPKPLTSTPLTSTPLTPTLPLLIPTPTPPPTRPSQSHQLPAARWFHPPAPLALQ